MEEKINLAERIEWLHQQIQTQDTKRKRGADDEDERVDKAVSRGQIVLDAEDRRLKGR